MKLYLFYFLLISITALSCKSLPVLEPANNLDKQLDTNPFLKKKYRLTHSIRVILPNSEKVLAIGITLADPEAGSIDAVLMTVEGFVIFDVSYKKNSFIINRSIPPFDGNDFAKALIKDIKLIYFIPYCKNTESGILNDRYIKRYRCEDKSVTDVIALKNGKGKIFKYDSSYDLIRTANIFSINQGGIPEKIELIAHGFFGYSLYLELIDFERIQTAE